jgi:hypothetical protein
MPREVLIFLVIGGGLSVASKALQFVPALREHEWLGNVIVLPAAACLVLGLLLALPPYRELRADDATRTYSLWLAALACVAVMSFQLLTMSFVSGRTQLGLILVVPALAAGSGFALLWLRVTG